MIVKLREKILTSLKAFRCSKSAQSCRKFQKIIRKISLMVPRPAVVLNINSIMLFLPASFLTFSESSWTATFPSYQKYSWNGKSTCFKQYRKINVLKKNFTRVSELSGTLRCFPEWPLRVELIPVVYIIPKHCLCQQLMRWILLLKSSPKN